MSKIDDIVNKFPDKKVSVSINILGFVRKIIKKIQTRKNEK